MKRFVLKAVFLFGILWFYIYPEAMAQRYFRSAATGNWNAITTWQMSDDTVNWSAATYSPTYTDYTITIRNNHVVTITSGVTMDEVTIEAGAILNANSSAALIIIANGIGPDLIIHGTFTDNLPSVNSINFNTGATWKISSGANLVKTTNSASNTWQQTYDGGIQNIPPDANWILRKNSSSNPAITTVGAYYPNLIIENFTSSTYSTPSIVSSFNGSSNYPTILGNFDIGGSGTNTVNFLNGHTNSNPTRVLGDLIVRTGNTLRNYGTGIEVRGDVRVDGSVIYDSNDRRLFDFSSSNEQTVSGSGVLNIKTMRMLKSSGSVTLLKPIAVDDSLYLNSGNIISSSSALLTIQPGAIVKNASEFSFVNGPVCKNGAEEFVFPIGSGTSYKPLAISEGGSSDSYIAQFYQTNPQLVFGNNFVLPIEDISTCEYWQLTKESGSVARSLTLYWDANSCGVTNPADVRIVYYDSLWSSIWNIAEVSNYNGSAISGDISSSDIDHFGIFTLAFVNISEPLPVTLVNFSAQRKTEDVELRWTTLSEINNDYFVLLSSADAVSFEETGRVKGRGNSTQAHDYFFTDAAVEGMRYYRLRQVDFDGKESLSGIISVQDAGIAAVSAFPNPFQDNFTVAISNPDADIQAISLSDVSGRILQHWTAGTQYIYFSSDNLSGGIYFLHIVFSNKKQTLRLIKQ